jgi:hypothetical protein
VHTEDLDRANELSAFAQESQMAPKNEEKHTILSITRS